MVFISPVTRTNPGYWFSSRMPFLIFGFSFFNLLLFFIVIQLQLYAFSPHPSTPPQPNPPPSPIFGYLFLNILKGDQINTFPSMLEDANQEKRQKPKELGKIICSNLPLSFGFKKSYFTHYDYTAGCACSGMVVNLSFIVHKKNTTCYLEGAMNFLNDICW